MLKTLTLRNLATIESLTARFSTGLNALTGETGAGKSIMVGGLELSLGERASAGVVRAGCNLAVAEAVFEPPLPTALAGLIREELGLEWDGGLLSLRREVSDSGRSRCFVNDQLVGVGDLKNIGALLVDMHGQHEHQSLLHASAHRGALDAYAGHDGLLEAYRAAWRDLGQLRRRHAELEEAALHFDQRLDYLNFQLEEYEALAPRPGELEELATAEQRLANVETLSRLAAEAYGLLYDNPVDDQPSLVALLAEVGRRVEEIAGYDEALAPAIDVIASGKAAFEDLAFTLRDYTESIEANPADLERVIQRVEAIRKLVRKHGGSEQAMEESMAAMRDERDRMTGDDEERRQIGKRLAEAEKALETLGRQLSESRAGAAAKMSREVLKGLGGLGMEKARFDIALEPLPQAGADGLDRVEFMLAANQGAEPAPLRKVASGGELSRVMLALKSVLAARDAIPTLVFDEIDAGISGETALRVGRVMEKLARHHQIFCITHHASIAARAGHHASVRKSQSKGETFTHLVHLDGQERLDELAQMMGGKQSGQAARDLARQLME